MCCISVLVGRSISTRCVILVGNLTAHPVPGGTGHKCIQQEENEMSEKLYFTEEVADMLRKSYGSMRFMIHKGTAPRSALIGGRRMFRESDIQAWLNEQFEKEA